MRRSDDEIMWMMEQDLARDRDLFFHFVRGSAPDKFWNPRVDVYETRDALRIRVELAGVRRDEIQVELSGDNREISIRGLRLDGEPDVGERTVFHHMEIYAGPFERTIVLPPSISIEREGVEAVYHDGILVVSLPKRVPPPPSRTRIQVQE